MVCPASSECQCYCLFTTRDEPKGPGIHWLDKTTTFAGHSRYLCASALLGASRDQSPGNLIEAGGATTMDRLEAVTIPPGDHDMQ